MHLASTAVKPTWPAPNAVANLDYSAVRQENAQLRIMTNELGHRIKNLVTIFEAIARQSMRQTTSKDEFGERFSGRLRAYGRSLDLLIANGWREARIDQLMRLALSPFGALDGKPISLEGTSLSLTSTAARSIGLALHELATNATKYGALSVPEGRVAVRWAFVGSGARRRFRISWHETDGPIVKVPTRGGFGRQVIQQLTAQALAGHAKHEFLPAGVRWTLDMPASLIVGAHSDVTSAAEVPGRGWDSRSQQFDR